MTEPISLHILHEGRLSNLYKERHNYVKENRWEDTPAEVRRREARNKARKEFERKGKVRKGDDKEVDHKAFTRSLRSPLNNDISNLHVITRHANRVKQPKRKR